MFRGFFRVEQRTWLLVFPICHFMIPWVQYRFRCIIPFSFLLVWCLSTLSVSTAHFNQRIYKAFFASWWWLVIYSLVPSAYALLGYGVLMRYDEMASMLNQLLFFYMSNFLFAERKFREIRFLTVISLFACVLAGVSAMRGLQIEGFEGAREMTGVTDANMYDRAEGVLQAREMGLGGYGFMYHCCWLMGPLLVAFVMIKNVQMRLLLLTAFVGCALCLKGGGLGTPVIVGAFGCMFFAAWYFTQARKLITIMGIFLAVIFFLYASVPTCFSFLSSYLMSIADSMNSGSLQERFISVAQMFDGETNTYAYTRVYMQMASWRTFLDFPIFGIFGVENNAVLARTRLGGHSFVLDLLGGYGVLGFVPFVIYLTFLMRYFKVLSVLYLGQRWLIMPIIFMSLFFFSSIANPTRGVPADFYYLLPGFAVLALWSRGELPCGDGGLVRVYSQYTSHWR